MPIQFFNASNDVVRVGSQVVRGAFLGASVNLLPKASPPTNLTATVPQENAKIALSWSAPEYNGAASITGYIVQLSSNNGSTWLDSNSAATTSTVVVNLTNNVSYRFRVAAISSFGRGAFSASVSATPKAVITITQHPQTVNLGSGAGCSMTIHQFSVTATTTLTTPLTYQWQVFGTSFECILGCWTDIAGATNSTYSTSCFAISASSGGKLRCVVSSGGESVTSNEASFTFSIV
jgi:hypothetical protein